MTSTGDLRFRSRHAGPVESSDRLPERLVLAEALLASGGGGERAVERQGSCG